MTAGNVVYPFLLRIGVGKTTGRPARTQQPISFIQVLGTFGEFGFYSWKREQPGNIAANRQVHTARFGVGVYVMKSGQQHLAFQVDHSTVGSNVSVGTCVVSNIDNVRASDDDSLGPGQALVYGVDGAVCEHDIGPVLICSYVRPARACQYPQSCPNNYAKQFQLSSPLACSGAFQISMVSVTLRIIKLEPLIRSPDAC